MSEFIKKNMPLVVILGITAVIAAVMIVLVAMQYSDINEKMSKIDEINDNINLITSQTNPRVVTENARLINEDAQALEQKTKEQQRVFGCYLDPALQVFIDTLKKQDLSDEFKKTVDGMTRESLVAILKNNLGEVNLENPQAEEVKKLYRAVKDEILASANAQDKDAYNKAFEAFIAEVSKLTLENLNDPEDKFAVKEAVFLQALGLPRSFEKIKFATYFDKYAEDLVKNKKVPFADEKDNNTEQIKVYFTTGVRVASQDDDEEGGLKLDKIDNSNIPHVMARVQIYENLIFNIRESGLGLISIRRVNDYKPDVAGDGGDTPYDTYSTEVKVYGTMKQIRDFANNLHQEYKNNRVYLVTYMNLSTDNSAKQEKVGRKQKNYNREINQTLGYVKMQEAEKKLDADDENAAKMREQNKTYLDSIGAPLVGVNDKVYAVFKINYIVFTGDQVTNAKK